MPLRTIPRFCFRIRPFSTSHVQRTPRPLHAAGPSPPRLPKEEQEIFERLQRSATGPATAPKHSTAATITNSTLSNTDANHTTPHNVAAKGAGQQQSDSSPGSNSSGWDEGTSHPDLRKPVKPDFKGDVNPRTGEVGGPKNEPLRWGASGDWSYKGRATDF
ncbi:MAG: putative mitochondrial protein, conserved [Peltula sp. TS41687]|nr:MAG: putative mitochondrial protein, conserved [Peltula sp. TS41687]